MALSLEVTTEPPPDISERSTISLRTRALARWGADAGYYYTAACTGTAGLLGYVQEMLGPLILTDEDFKRIAPGKR